MNGSGQFRAMRSRARTTMHVARFAIAMHVHIRAHATSFAVHDHHGKTFAPGMHVKVRVNPHVYKCRVTTAVHVHTDSEP